MKKITLGKNKEIIDAEIWGISEALDIALREPVLQSCIMHVNIFSHSQKSPNKFCEEQTCEGKALKAQIYQKASELKCKGYKVTLRLVLSHKK